MARQPRGTGERVPRQRVQARPDTAADVFQELGDRRLQARRIRTRAEVLIDAGRRTEAPAPAGEAVRMYQSRGDQVGETRARDILARAERREPNGSP